ncbi:hypothetical protein M5689_006171 [Euphorbia peplus]|nr:hypothetical protein M5689_006171 [Euphorbia peplus]
MEYLTSNQKAVVKIVGKYSLFELSGSVHKLIRGAIVGFIKPESIHRFVAELDSLVHQLLLKELDGNDSRQIMKLMKKIAFHVTCSILFGTTNEKEKK